MQKAHALLLVVQFRCGLVLGMLASITGPFLNGHLGGRVWLEEVVYWGEGCPGGLVCTPFFPPLTVLATLFGAPLLHLMFPPKYSSSAHMVPKHRSKGPDERSRTAAGRWDIAFSPAAKHSWRGSELFWLLWTAVALWREVAGSDVSRDTRKGLSTFLIGTLGPVLKAAPGGRRARHPTM